MSEKYGIGIVGFGIVGGGVAEMLRKQRDEIFSQTGKKIEVQKIGLRNFSSKDLKGYSSEIFTEDVLEVCEDDKVETVVELIGGTTIAKTVIEKALNNKKNVVTANKALIAEYGNELLETAKKNGVKLLFEASVAGGIPILRTLRTHYNTGSISRISGILNGTCNYILSELEKGGRSYESVLKEAQEKGFAESDPTFDVEGYDAVQKLAILISLAFGVPIPNWKEIPINGISSLTEYDFEFAKKYGKKIRLVGRAKKTEEGILMALYPRMLDEKSFLAKRDGAENAVFIEDSFIGDVLLCGPGAGAYPTAGSVISDILEVVRGDNISPSAFLNQKPFIGADRQTTKKRSYFRIPISDEVGVLSTITQVFAEEEISIDQVENGSSDKPISFLLHLSPITAIEKAKEKISKLSFVTSTPLVLIVE